MSALTWTRRGRRPPKLSPVDGRLPPWLPSSTSDMYIHTYCLGADTATGWTREPGRSWPSPLLLRRHFRGNKISGRARVQLYSHQLSYSLCKQPSWSLWGSLVWDYYQIFRFLSTAQKRQHTSSGWRDEGKKWRNKQQRQKTFKCLIFLHLRQQKSIINVHIWQVCAKEWIFHSRCVVMPETGFWTTKNHPVSHPFLLIHISNQPI